MIWCEEIVLTRFSNLRESGSAGIPSQFRVAKDNGDWRPDAYWFPRAREVPAGASDSIPRPRLF